MPRSIVSVKPTIQCTEEEYRIVCGDEEGELFDYGEVATLEAGDGRILVAKINFDTSEAVTTELPGGVWLKDVATGNAVECDVIDVEIANLPIDDDYEIGDPEEGDDDGSQDDEDEDGEDEPGEIEIDDPEEDEDEEDEDGNQAT